MKQDLEAKSLDEKLLQTILSRNFDEMIIQNLLEQGASPTKRYSGTETAPLGAALKEWIAQGLAPNTPIDRACRQLKRYAKELRAAQGPFPFAPSSAQIYYTYLFGEEPPVDPDPLDKRTAIKKIFVDIYSLLSSPEKCILLFETIEQELILEWKKTHEGPIPKLDEKEYQIQCHDGTLYPIPRDEYKKACFPKKYSALQRTLYQMMCKTGFVKIPPQKWVQGIPREKSKEYLKQNVFFVDDRSHPTGLLHGKVSHNIQRLLIYLAIKKELVKISVSDITIEDLFSALMDKQYANQETKSLLWVRLLDSRHFSHITFTDPHRLHSFLMTSERRSQFRFLSDCMIHSFCNGVVEISEILNHYRSDKMEIWTPKKVWDRILSCMLTEYFFDFRLNVDFRESKKGYAPIIARGEGREGKDRYIIVEKDYTGKREIKKQITEPGMPVASVASSDSLPSDQPSVMPKKPAKPLAAVLKEAKKNAGARSTDPSARRNRFLGYSSALLKKIESDKRFKKSDQPGVLFEGNSSFPVDDKDLMEYGAKIWTREKISVLDHVVLILEMEDENKKSEMPKEKVTKEEKEKPVSASQPAGYQPRFLSHPLKPMKESLKTLFPEMTWYPDEDEKVAWAYFENQDKGREFSDALTRLFALWNSFSIKANTYQTHDGRFFVKLEGIDGTQAQLLVAHEACRRTLQAVMPSIEMRHQ